MAEPSRSFPIQRPTTLSHDPKDGQLTIASQVYGRLRSVGTWNRCTLRGNITSGSGETKSNAPFTPDSLLFNELKNESDIATAY